MGRLFYFIAPVVFKIVRHLDTELNLSKANQTQSDVNTALDGSTYPG